MEIKSASKSKSCSKYGKIRSGRPLLLITTPSYGCPEALFGFWLDLSGEVTIAVEYRTAPAAVDCPTALFGFWLDLLVGHAMT